MKETYYVTLIHRELTGVATPGETEILQHWISLSLGNAAYYDACIRIWEHRAVDNIYTPPQDEQVQLQRNRLRENLVEFQARERRNIRSIAYVKVAATILMGTILAFTAWQVAQPDVFIATSRRYLSLADNSGIAMNTNATVSLLRIPDKVLTRFSGQGFFKVGDKNTMLVTLDVGIITASEAEFFISTSADSVSCIMVERGGVKITYEGTSIFLKAGEQAVITRGSRIPVIEPTSPNDFAWYTNTCRFEKSTLAQIIALLSEQYSAEIYVADESLLESAFTGTFINQNVATVMESLSSSLGFMYELRNGVYYIYTAAP